MKNAITKTLASIALQVVGAVVAFYVWDFTPAPMPFWQFAIGWVALVACIEWSQIVKRP